MHEIIHPINAVSYISSTMSRTLIMKQKLLIYGNKSKSGINKTRKILFIMFSYHDTLLLLALESVFNWNFLKYTNTSKTNEDLKISIFVLIHIKIIPWSFSVLNPKNSWVMHV